MRKYITIITDSRGSWLQQAINRLVDYRFSVKVIYRRGGGLRDLWEIAEWTLISRKIDLLIILGGVCDMTTMYHDARGRRQVWTPDNLGSRFAEIKSIMVDMSNNFKLIAGYGNKLVFLPDPGIDMIRYNRLLHPVPWRALVFQEELEKYVKDLHEFTRELNAENGSLTPWSLDVTHSFRNGTLIPIYDRMRDGLHFSTLQTHNLAKKIMVYVEREMNPIQEN